MIKKQIDDLIFRMNNAKYNSSVTGEVFERSVLSPREKNQQVAARQAISEWIQDNFIETNRQISSLEAKVFVLETAVKNSNFAPILETKNNDATGELEI